MKTVRNIPPQKASQPIGIIKMLEILAKESDYRLKYLRYIHFFTCKINTEV